MYEKKVGRAYLRGCLHSLAAGAVGALLGITLLAVVLWLIRGGAVEPRSPRFTLALAMPLLLVAALVAGAAGVVRARGARLDRAFRPWRLRGRQTGAAMRSWHGTVGSRPFDAWIHRGPTLELYLGCTPATRGVIHRGGALVRAIARAVGSRTPLEPSPLDLAGVSVYADDPRWMRRLLARREVGRALSTLMRESSRTATAIFLMPNAVRYMRRFQPLAGIDADTLGRWVGDLDRLAAAVDAVGPSDDGRRPDRLEEWARTSRGRHLNRILLALGLLLLGVMAVLFLFAWLFVGQG